MMMQKLKLNVLTPRTSFFWLYQAKQNQIHKYFITNIHYIIIALQHERGDLRKWSNHHYFLQPNVNFPKIMIVTVRFIYFVRCTHAFM